MESGVIQKDAVISECQAYRYSLTRTWDEARPKVFIIGLNPSTADDKIDDPTIRREMAFAKAWGYGGLLKGNLFAYRATKPKHMKAARDPVGLFNNRHLLEMSGQSDVVVCAWGTHGWYLGRDQIVANLLGPAPLKCLGVTKEGHAKHPLYVKTGTPLVDWDRRTAVYDP